MRSVNVPKRFGQLETKSQLMTRLIMTSEQAQRVRARHRRHRLEVSVLAIGRRSHSTIGIREGRRAVAAQVVRDGEIDSEAARETLFAHFVRQHASAGEHLDRRLELALVHE
jgi:hypothetical protein